MLDAMCPLCGGGSSLPTSARNENLDSPEGRDAPTEGGARI